MKGWKPWKEKKPKKPKKDKKVAWNSTKQSVIKDLLQERVRVESSPSVIEDWDLSRTWMQIINSHVNDAQKQLILNDLIDDKVHYLGLVQDQHSASITDLQVTIDQGNALKE